MLYVVKKKAITSVSATIELERRLLSTSRFVILSANLSILRPSLIKLVLDHTKRDNHPAISSVVLVVSDLRLLIKCSKVHT